MNLKEQFYITRRKIKAFGNKLCFKACALLFPIKKNRIAVCTFEGKGGFGCNPKYIVQELHSRNPKYEFVWFVNDINKEFPDYIKKIPNTLFNRAYWLSTSKIWIDNYRKPYGTTKRKRQYYFQTWHGTIGFKSTGLWRGRAFSKMAYLVSKNDSDMIDYVVIDSKWCEEMFPKGLVYDGNFLKTGAPRCDILYGDRKKHKEEYRRKNNIDANAKIVLFAPTFREGSNNGVRSVFSEVWSLDFERLIKNLEKRFGGEWILCIRVHPQLAPSFKYVQNNFNIKIIDESKADDMYEILSAVDAYITDYSCAAMEAGFMHIPVFIYADDIEKYVSDRGSLLWDMKDISKVTNNKLMTPGIDTMLPYSISTNNDELEKNIINFDNNAYNVRLNKFEKDVDLVFDGNASKKVADKIEEYINKK